MKKILYCASTDSHILNFHIPYLKALKALGYEVWVAANGTGRIPYTDRVIQTRFAKNLLSMSNLKQVIDFYKLLSVEHFDIVHTHTTLAAAVVRLAILLRGKRGTKVINTSHGYFFWRGSSVLKWMIFLPVEKICKLVTDIVVTMNKEDLYLADKYKLSLKGTYFIKGMGIDLNRFKPMTNEEKFVERDKAGLPKDAFVMIYSAELSKRKNHMELLKALIEIKKKNQNVLLLCAGKGVLEGVLVDFIEKNKLESNVRLLGYCAELEKMYPLCDLAVSTSLSEGLPLNILESMACGVPIVASSIKGHTDLIVHEVNGLLYESGNREELVSSILYLMDREDVRDKFRRNSLEQVKDYASECVVAENLKVYEEIL